MTANRIIAVLGMHRSGTSCLTGMMENAGICLGEVSRKNPFNKKGNNENRHIVALHDSLLEDSGYRWDAPPFGGCAWGSEHREDLEGIIGRNAELPGWGFKDPRSLFTLEGWLERLPELEFVGSFRHPVAVARSLMSRGNHDFGRSLDLWWAYNRRLLQFQRRFGFDLVCFDLEPERYVEQVLEACRRLDLHPERDAMTFFDTGLRNQSRDDSQLLPPDIRSMYRKLLRRAL